MGIRHYRIACVLVCLWLTGTAIAAEDAGKYSQWIREMKAQPRGPFDGVRWYCKDGTVLPPQQYACQPHGGGHQHGQWSAHTREIRGAGYKIATLLAGLDAQAWVTSPDFIDTYSQLIVEKYLVSADDGWILRQALSYRGAIQEEDEREGARQLLQAMALRPEWSGVRYPALRIGARYLPHGEDKPSVQAVREKSASLAGQDPAFQPLRAKIHNAPDAGDAAKVREYAQRVSNADRKAGYLQLADQIDALYRAEPLPNTLRSFAAHLPSGSAARKAVEDGASQLASASDPAATHRTTGTLLAALRDGLTSVSGSARRLELLDVSLAVESEHFKAGEQLRSRFNAATREQRVQWLKSSIDAAYGTGLLRARERSEWQEALATIPSGNVGLQAYLGALEYFNHVPAWGTQGLRFHFGEAMDKLAKIEPMADLFVQNELRGSPLLAYSVNLDGLVRDANRVAGVKHKLFDEEIGTGFRALNPGLARGTLHGSPSLDRLNEFRPDGIYLLPETVSELPPVSGIMTAGEGNPLSHVQLLARNLGIPNVGVDQLLIPKVRTHDRQKVVLAVSRAGLVELAADGPRWNSYFAQENRTSDVIIVPDMKKLNLNVRDFVNLDKLRADDSGRIVGPKAAKLGELRASFPDKVAPGVGIPFGLFRKVVLDKPYRGPNPRGPNQTIFEWTAASFRALEKLPAGSAELARESEKVRAEIYDIIMKADVGDEFRQGLRRNLASTLGPEPWRVFVRSDTNVEDLPGFTGAGLNLTLPNVIGYEHILKAINEVWASPYTERAFAWRQSHMRGPENVYPAVLLLQSIDSDKSGVMVTADLETGDRQVLSVAVNEGVGGAVEGQAAETIRVDTRDGAVKLLSSATSPRRHSPGPAPQGGLVEVYASGTDTVLQPGEISQLIQLWRDLPAKFPPVVDDEGKPAPADIEYAFVNGQLKLLQIRPFLQSRRAQASAYLAQMDSRLKSNLSRTVNLREVAAP